MEQTMIQPVWNNVAEVELVYKSKVKASERPVIRSSRDSYKCISETWDENKIEFVEQFKVLLLNAGNKVLGIFEVSSGGVTGTVADPRIIFTAALKAHATRLILSHNHPSGSLRPSEADIHLTKKITTAGQYLDIQVLDHVIISKEGYYSFADEGLM